MNSSSTPTSDAFAGLIGNTAARAQLLDDYRRQRFPSAYLLHGPASLGKRRIALRLATSANCGRSRPEAPRICGECPSCKKIAGGNHPMVHVLEPVDTSAIKIAPVRDVLELLSLKVGRVGRQFLIIDPAEALTREAANALLKTVEEPPPLTTIILISSHLHKVLPTLRSRCRPIAFHPIPLDEMTEQYAASRRWEHRSARLLATLSGGTFALSEDEAAEAVLTLREQAADLLDQLALRDFHAAFGSVPSWTKEEGALGRLLPLLESLMRDAALLAAGVNLPLMHEDLRDRLSNYARRLSISRLLEAAEEAGRTALWIFERNLNRELALNRLMMAMAPPAGGRA